MGFRDEERARFHRIQALETELEERDRKIAELEAALKGKRAKKKSREGKEGAPRVEGRPVEEDIPEVEDVPEGDRWTMRIHRPTLWMLEILYVGGLAGVLWWWRVVDGKPWGQLLIPVLFSIPVLFALHRRYVVMDKVAGTVTRVNWVLLARWAKVVRYRGQSVRVELEYRTPEDEKPYWYSKVFIGEVKLFGMPPERASVLARRIAAFLEIPCRTVKRER